ncbi:MAG: hypothetical protein M3298_01140, partial [Thermoproteota archaeon]|nr:hypothetical protein [Thermoproteota archaeon]
AYTDVFAANSITGWNVSSPPVTTITLPKHQHPYKRIYHNNNQQYPQSYYHNKCHNHNNSRDSNNEIKQFR